MPIRSITLIHNGQEFEESALKTALSLTKSLNGLLKILHASYVARPAPSYFGEAALLGAGFEEAVERQARADLERSRNSAQAACQAAGLPLSETASSELPRAEFVPRMGYTNRALTRELSLCDLIVVGAPKGSQIIDDTIVNIALFSTARPVLLVRPGQEMKAQGSVCGFAWSGSEEATHALVNGIGLLENASKVHLLTANEKASETASEDQEQALAYLAAHGIDSTLTTVARQGDSAARAILKHAQEAGCDYIAMGAYGHSVFRETLLGGFSETMLDEAELPLLLCH